MNWPIRVNGAHIGHLQVALNKVNNTYGNNIKWGTKPYAINGYEPDGIRFTLRVINAYRMGSSFSLTFRRQSSACWHVHHLFFKHLLAINEFATIVWPNGEYLITKRNAYRELFRDIYLDNGTEQPRRMSSLCSCTALNVTGVNINDEYDARTLYLGPPHRPTPPTNPTPEPIYQAVLRGTCAIECIPVQLGGSVVCEGCVLNKSPFCNGRRILRTGRNLNGNPIPLVRNNE